MQFVFEGRVCLNGKDLRTWSAARAEIQSTFVAAMDFVRSPQCVPCSGSDAAENIRVDAMELAQMLCKTFVAAPIHSVVIDEDESQVLRRVANVMATEYSAVALPLKTFLNTYMKMPIFMHDVVKDCLSKHLDSP